MRCTKAKKSPRKFGSVFFHPGSCCFYQRKMSNVNYFLEDQPQTKGRSQSKVLRHWCKCPQLVWLGAEGTFLISDRIRSLSLSVLVPGTSRFDFHRDELLASAFVLEFFPWYIGNIPGCGRRLRLDVFHSEEIKARAPGRGYNAARLSRSRF